MGLDAVIEIKVVVGALLGATVEVEGAIGADGAVDGEEAGQVGDIKVPLKMAARRPLFVATGLEPVVDDELIEEENVVDRRLVTSSFVSSASCSRSFVSGARGSAPAVGHTSL